MATIMQQALALDSQNQLRNADKMARDWAIAHAGRYKGQARRELRGNAPVQEWQRDNITIRVSKPLTPAVKQAQIVSVRYQPSGDGEAYTGYVMTYGYLEGDGQGGYCMSVVSRPDAAGEDALPWGNDAGVPGLETIVAALSADRARPVGNAADAGAVNTIDDLFSQHDTAIVLTEEGRKDEAFPELAASHDDWANVVNISAAEQLVISRELPFPQVPDWVWAKIAVFNRYPDGEGHRLRMMATERDQASDYLAGERDRIVNGLANRNSLNLMELLESLTSVMATLKMPEAQKVIAEALLESEGKAKEDDSPSAAENMVTRQRIYLLQDQLDEANFTIEELKERLALYESYDQGDDADEAGGNDAPETEEARENNVLTAIADPARFPRLRFLTNCAKPLADFGKRRPNGGEIVAALDAINTLAQTWFDTPGGSIGNWDNYFTHLKPGWTHANGESSFTMSRYGAKRSFSDQDQRRQVTIERHLTYRGSDSGLQIYFDRDDVTDSFIVGYIGEHLPYATNRS